MKHLEDFKYQVIGGGEREGDYSEQGVKTNDKAEQSIVWNKNRLPQLEPDKKFLQDGNQIFGLIGNEDHSSCISSLQARKALQQKENVIYTSVSDQNHKNLAREIHWLQKHNYAAKEGIQFSDGIRMCYNFFLQRIHITGIATVLQIFNLLLKMFTGHLTLTIKHQLKSADGKI